MLLNVQRHGMYVLSAKVTVPHAMISLSGTGVGNTKTDTDRLNVDVQRLSMLNDKGHAGEEVHPSRLMRNKIRDRLVNVFV